MRYLFSYEHSSGADKAGVKQLDPVLPVSQLPLDGQVFFIEMKESRHALDLCRLIRGHALPAVHLRPIVLLDRRQEIDRQLRAAVDGQLSAISDSGSAGQIEEFIGMVNRKIESLPGIFDVPVSNIALKVLRFLFVREKRAIPVKTVATRYGFSYPDLELFLQKADESLFGVLDFLKQQCLLTTDFVEKAYFCNQCGSAFLNFLEQCPHCQSADLAVEDLVHHFKCAFVAPATEFQRNGQLICPKCEQKLNDIGVDFDKPSIVYTCNECSHVTQEPEVMTACYNCGKKALPENQVHRTMYAYTLTGLGENCAVYGLESLFRNVLDKSVPLIPYESFLSILRMEISRIHRYKKSQSSLILFQMSNLDRIYLEFGSQAKEIFGELSTIFTSILRDSDVVTSLTESIFLALLVETPENGAKNALKRLSDQIDQLLATNLQEELDIVTQVFELQPELTPEETISRMTEDDVS